MNAQVKPIPEDMHSLTPYLICAGASDAMEWYKRAFDAVDCGRLAGPDGKLMHGMVRIGDSALMLSDENPEWGAIGPKSLPSSPVTIHLYVENVDDTYARAVKEGAVSKMPPADMFWGDRFCNIVDPFGHSWSIATHIREVSPEEMQAAAKMGCSEAAKQEGVVQ
ncbi:VOC family protein [Massilia sp. PAMC28688]|uniref:VOC family protein n=1 Tax=Massilia sp. PAMC28688 TaxID=2861283 RepID=UPI001C6357CC|nr:VOC family protein [Massilia sp. PAMC28688]QYF95441.1 VOC family protein [Massilia sp. PAMC28688]